MDVVTADGDVLVAYHVAARLGSLNLYCASVEGRVQGESVRADGFSFAARKLPAPRLDCEQLAWSVVEPGIELEARACQRADPIELFDGNSGSIRWWPMLPAATVRTRLRGQALAGIGYVERLELQMRLRRLPIRTLWWGRWIGDRGSSLVWVRWDGASRLTRLIADGRPTAGVVAERYVECERGRLELEPLRQLRSGNLASTVFAEVPLLWRLASRDVHLWRESKWLSRATLAGEVGWSIHERVDFRGSRL